MKTGKIILILGEIAAICIFGYWYYIDRNLESLGCTVVAIVALVSTIVYSRNSENAPLKSDSNLNIKNKNTVHNTGTIYFNGDIRIGDNQK